MYYTIYKTINKINGKVYYGKHITDNLYDGYLGSGKYLKRAIKKYGKDSFEKLILYIFSREDEMVLKEKELITENVVKDDSTYNLKIGGEGGWEYVNKNGKAMNKEHGILGGSAHMKKMSEDNEYREKVLKRLEKHRNINREKGMYEWTYFGNCSWHEKALLSAKSSEAIKKRKDTFKKIGHQQGINNSQYGLRWIHSDAERKAVKVKKEDVQIWIDKGWKPGARFKW